MSIVDPAPTAAKPGARRAGGVTAGLARFAEGLLTPFQAGRRAPGRREALVALLLAVVGAVALYGPHAVNGGWYMDDYALISQAEYAGGGFDALGELLDVGYRPMFSFTIWVLYMIGGTGQSAYLAAGVALIAIQVWSLYLALRVVGLAGVVAAGVALVHLTIPSIDGSRLWMTALPAWVAVTLYLWGLIVAIRGSQSASVGRRRGAHAAALVLYALAILCYELISPLIALSALLYLPTTGVRPALRRWVADVVVVGVVLAAMSSRQNRVIELTVDYLRGRIEEVWGASVDVFRLTLPAESLLWGPLGLALVLGGAVGVGLAIGRRGEWARTARTWCAITGAGLLFGLAGLLFLVPAEPYYHPRWTGIGNRVASMSSMGEAVLIVGLAVLVVLGLLTLARQARWTVAVSVIAVLMWTASLARQEMRNQDPWAESWKQSQRVLAAVRQAVPDPPPDATIVTFRHTRNILPADVPVFNTTWDLDGAVKLAYDDPTLHGQPGGPATRCDATGIAAVEDAPALTVPYGTTYFVDAAGYTGWRVTSRRQCDRLLAQLRAG